MLQNKKKLTNNNELIKHFSKSSVQNSSMFVTANKQTANTNNNNCNHSCIAEFNLNSNDNSKKRGRKKVFLDGIKREIIDKAFLRQFRMFIKEKMIINKSFELLNIENDKEKLFWNEFLQQNNPPFLFTINEKKVLFKSFSQQFMYYIFSYPSVRSIYYTFIKEKENKIINSIFNKKTKRFDEKMLKFYSFYGGNLHKIYSQEMSEINIDELINLSNIYNENINNNYNNNLNTANITPGNSNNNNNMINFFTDSINTSV